MIPDRLRSNKGVAVIMAMGVILLVVTAALELHIDERANMVNAAVSRDRLTLEEMTRSGIHLAMAVLIKDRIESESDSLQEDWADAEFMAGMVNELGYTEGKLKVAITDEMGKIQINSLVQFPEGSQFNDSQRAMWERFAAAILAVSENEKDQPLEDTDPLTIIYSIKDWLDSGDDDAITGLSGAESDYYESLDPPYACKNGPFDDLSEVRLVKGITPELFNGIGGAAGLEAYLTTYGAEEAGDGKFSYPGRININTADLPVLTALLPPESAEFAEAIVAYREATSGSLYTNDLTQLNWYKNVPGLAGTSIDENLITVSSQFFRITATATLDQVRLTTTAVIERVKPSETAQWQCKVLNWKSQ